jgi:type II secretory pathway component PulF
MAAFNYSARDNRGTIVEGTIEAPYRREALRRLQLKDLKPLKVEEVGASKKKKSAIQTLKKMNLQRLSVCHFLSRWRI